MGDWKTAGDNVVRGQQLINKSANPRIYQEDQYWTDNGTFRQDNQINSSQPFNAILENNSITMKKQTSPYHTILDTRPWKEHEDVYLFAKVKASAVFDYIRLFSSPNTGLVNIHINMYACDPHTHKPFIWDRQTIDTTNLTIADDDGNNRTKFSISDPNIIDTNDFTNYNLLTVSGSSTVSDGTYVMNNIERTSSTNMDFTLSSDPDAITTSYLDVRDGESTLNDQSATFSYVRSTKIYGFRNHGIDLDASTGLPNDAERGIYQSWYTTGRTHFEMAKGQYLNRLVPTTHIDKFRAAYKSISPEDYVYWGFDFRRPIASDDGHTYFNIGAELSYGVYE